MDRFRTNVLHVILTIISNIWLVVKGLTLFRELLQIVLYFSLLINVININYYLYHY